MTRNKKTQDSLKGRNATFSTPLDPTTTSSMLSSSALDEWLEQDLERSGLVSPSPSMHSSPDMTAANEAFMPSPSPMSSTPLPSPEKEEAEEMGNKVDRMKNQFAMAFSQAMPAPPPLSISPIYLSYPMIGAHSPLPVHHMPFPTDPGNPQRSAKRACSPMSCHPLNYDDATVKRQKNTDAARRSRLRKAQKMETLETRASDLEKDNTSLQLRSAVLESEKTGLEDRTTSLQERIENLEAQLAKVRGAIINKTPA